MGLSPSLKRMLAYISKGLRLFVYDKRAIGAKTAILMGVAFFLVAVVFPIGMTEVMGANTTDWNSAVVTIFQTLLPILAVIGIAIKFLPSGKGK